MNGYSDDLCTAIYESHNERRVTFVKNEGILKDAITNKKFNLCNFTSLNYTPPSKSAFKYFKSQFLQHRDETVFNATEVIETNLGMLSLPLLRFFNIPFSELIKTTNPKAIILKVSNKCKKYIKRYVPAEIAETYFNQIILFSNLIEIFSFIPEEIKAAKIPFWHLITQEAFADRIVYSLSGGITIKITETCNNLNINLVDLFGDKENYKKKLYGMRTNIIEEYKQKVLNAALTKISEAKSTLEEERFYATEHNDFDLLTEIEIIKDQLLELENSISNTIMSMPHDNNVVSWWPDLLYPAPTLTFKKDANAFFDVIEVREYFHLL